LELAPALPEVSGDPVQLQQVIINLAVNGTDAMAAVDDGPRDLTIRSRQESLREILVEVQDSGTGIDPGDEERIFDAFFTTKRDGMGMGLSICRSIIEGHGGRLWASRNPERGATFHFTLPVHQRAEP
jgi:signal transduction histidine kinase